MTTNKLLKILLIGGPADGKTINVPEDTIIRQLWAIYIPNPNNWNNHLLYKARTVDGTILKSKSFDAIIFDYCDE